MTDFTTVRSVGGLLPPDLLQRIVANDPELGGLTPRDYGLADTDRVGEAAARAWNRAKAYWAALRAATEELRPTESGVTQTRRQWLRPLLRELGYGEVASRATEEVHGRRYSISHRAGPVPIHLESFRQSLDHAAPAASGQRRISPHALLQEYLNVTGTTYGLVSNGLVLRLLRNNVSLTRQAYLEFDLEAMLEGGVYADFVLLYLVLHRSRLPREGQEAGQCWLERWRERAEAQGTRALGELRKGVEAAITALGSGFLAHPANERLRQRLAKEELSVQGYYQQLLRLIYRLIFLFAAEERNLVFPAGADPEGRRRYLEHYSASRLRGLARKYLTDDRHDDLWRGLRVTFQLLAGERQGLGVPALGGGLFDAQSCPDLDASLLRNDALAEAIRALSWVRVGKVTRRVNYRDMDAEELGGVYEGLLERQPQVLAEARQPRFELVGSGQRKQTGSYYTPTPLVQELIRSALEPVIADRLERARTPEERRQAILRIAVCDPACGSGHFLLAAARRLADELARLDSGGAEPGLDQLRQALRQVIRHCLYGVDANPLAVDLCKLALWLEGHDPGRPLTFLDHHIKRGNSLIGATWELLAGGLPDEAFEPVLGDDRRVASQVKRRNRQERAGQLALATELAGWEAARAAMARQMEAFLALPEDGLPRLREQRAAYQAVQADPRHEAARRALDTWTAAFFWELHPGAPEPPTSAALAAAGPDRPPPLAEAQRRVVERLRAEHGFFHWPLEFPEVFARGGFDGVLGNPPWERIKLQEQEFFAERDPAIARAPNKAARQRLIEALATDRPDLYATFQAARRAAEAQSKFVRASGRFPLTAVGDVNLYALFAEHDYCLINERGRAGVIVPTGIATDDSTKRFFQTVVERRSLAALFDFENRQKLFPDVDSRMKFCLLTLAGQPAPAGDFAFFLTSVEHLRDDRRRFRLSAEDFALLNPNTRTCPVFRTRVDAELTKAIYRRVPVLVDERRGLNPWGVEFMQGLFNMTSDSHLFHDRPGPGRVPLYEAKLFHQFNHRWATYDGGDAREATPAELADPSWQVRPRYWVERSEVETRLAERWDRGWLLVLRNVARATDERTAIFSVISRVGVGHSAPTMFPRHARRKRAAILLANLTALPFDYVVRQKLGGVNMTYGYVYQFPVLPPSAFTEADLAFIVPRVLELTYTAWDLQPFARDLGYDGPPFKWDEDRRALLRAELDAYYAALYGLTRDELRYILDPQDVYGPDFPGETFRVLKEREIRQYGEYRTRRLVLEAWDRLGLEPRNRDGRYEVEGTGRSKTTVVLGATDGRPGRASRPSTESIAPRQARAGNRAAPPPTTRQSSASPKRNGDGQSKAATAGPAPWPVEQPALPGLPVSRQLTLGAASASPLKQRRQAQLQLVLDVLARHGQLTAADIAAHLQAIGHALDEKAVRSLLYLEGAEMVERVAATDLFRVRSEEHP